MTGLAEPSATSGAVAPGWLPADNTDAQGPTDDFAADPLVLPQLMQSSGRPCQSCEHGRKPREQSCGVLEGARKAVIRSILVANGLRRQQRCGIIPMGARWSWDRGRVCRGSRRLCARGCYLRSLICVRPPSQWARVDSTSHSTRKDQL